MKELYKYYDSVGAIELDNGGLISKDAYRICGYADQCLENGVERNTGCDKITFPYIGTEYQNSKSKILILGLNGCGSEFISQIKLMMDAIVSFQKGDKKIRFGNKSTDYSGTIVYHRAIVYATEILKKLSVISDSLPDGEESEKYVEAMDRIAFLEAVKCSGKEVSGTMKENCQSKFLINEISILDPDIILVLGLHTLVDEIFKYSAVNQKNDMEFGQAETKKKSVKVFKIIHPTAFGGNNTDHFNQFRELVQQSL